MSTPPSRIEHVPDSIDEPPLGTLLAEYLGQLADIAQLLILDDTPIDEAEIARLKAQVSDASTKLTISRQRMKSRQPLSRETQLAFDKLDLLEARVLEELDAYLARERSITISVMDFRNSIQKALSEMHDELPQSIIECFALEQV